MARIGLDAEPPGRVEAIGEGFGFVLSDFGQTEILPANVPFLDGIPIKELDRDVLVERLAFARESCRACAEKSPDPAAADLDQTEGGAAVLPATAVEAVGPAGLCCW